MGRKQVPHYSTEAIDEYNSCVEKLRPFFGVDERSSIFIMPGSGSVALDIAVGSIVSSDSEIIAAVNGTFSNRVKLIVESYGAKVIHVTVPHGAAISASIIKQSLEEHPAAKAVFLAHLETSTGVLNPIEEIGEVASSFNVPLVVDAVSSLGVEKIDCVRWGVSVCCSASQKGLESPPGLGIVCVTPKGWDFINRNSMPKNGWYCDLNLWKKAAEGNEIRKGVFYPLTVTMPVNNVYALSKSLDSLLSEGLENRLQRHSRIAQITREGLIACGFKPFPEDSRYSSVETVMSNNLKIDINEMIHFIMQHYNTEISNGLFDLYNKILRIGHIGQTASLDSIVPVLIGIEQFLRKNGIPVPLGKSLEGIDKGIM